METTPTIGARLFAWVAHGVTLSGLLWASLAVVSLIDGRIAEMWMWLGIALIVDALDGTIARAARVKEVVPWFDGGVLDVVIDYLTWTFIPAIFMYLYLPLGPKPLAMAMLALVVASSMFCYANKGWKSDDNYFVGFPAAWNIVAVIMWVLGTHVAINVGFTIGLAILTLVPTHYTHPFRVQNLMVVNILAVAMWIVATAWLVAVHPQRPWSLLTAFWVGGGWFIVSGFLRTILGRRKAAR